MGLGVWSVEERFLTARGGDLLIALFGLFRLAGARTGLCAVLRDPLAARFRGEVTLAGLGATLRDV